MALLLSVIVILLFYSSQVVCQPTIIPLYTCWFYSYRGEIRIINAILGYNSSESTNITLPYGSNNVVLSEHIEAGKDERPTLFLPGLHRFVYSIRINEANAPGALFAWGLVSNQEQEVLSLEFPSSFTQDVQCLTRFSQQCLPEASVFVNFCEDSSYCNGRERCVGGSCLPGTPILCADPTLTCNESARCLPASTGAPSEAPTQEDTVGTPGNEEPVDHAEPSILYGNIAVILIILVFCGSVLFVVSRKGRRWG